MHVYVCRQLICTYVRMYIIKLCIRRYTYIATRNETGSGQLGQPGHMFCLSQPDLARFVKYPGLTLRWITCVINGVWT